MRVAFLVSFLFAAVVNAAPKWTWKGDLRLRGQVESPDPHDTRWTEAYRARFGLRASLDEALSAHLRLATGKSNRSANQTLGDAKEPGFPRRTLGLDLAFAEWRATEFLSVDVGRFPLRHYRPGDSQLLLDSDLALEGGALRTEFAVAAIWSVFGSVGSTWVRENYDTLYSEKLTDNMIHWLQAGLECKSGDLAVRFGGGFFNFVGFQGAAFSDLAADGKPNGNSEAAPGVVRNLFVPRQIFFEASWVRSEGNWGVFAERISNEETRDPREGAWIGAKWSLEPWALQVGWMELQSDATPAIFADSDFAAGRTNSRGSVFSLRRDFGSRVWAQLTHYATEAVVQDESFRMTRTQMDAGFMF